MQLSLGETAMLEIKSDWAVCHGVLPRDRSLSALRKQRGGAGRGSRPARARAVCLDAARGPAAAAA